MCNNSLDRTKSASKSTKHTVSRLSSPNSILAIVVSILPGSGTTTSRKRTHSRSSLLPLDSFTFALLLRGSVHRRLSQIRGRVGFSPCLCTHKKTHTFAEIRHRYLNLLKQYARVISYQRCRACKPFCVVDAPHVELSPIVLFLPC